jgi:hypothetical protein
MRVVRRIFKILGRAIHESGRLHTEPTVAGAVAQMPAVKGGELSEGDRQFQGRGAGSTKLALHTRRRQTSRLG